MFGFSAAFVFCKTPVRVCRSHVGVKGVGAVVSGVPPPPVARLAGGGRFARVSRRCSCKVEVDFSFFVVVACRSIRRMLLISDASNFGLRKQKILTNL